MPVLNEEMYCHQQICIPPTFPYLLRQYAKAAIRSQPRDLLKWSSAYFRALALGLTPPTKLRLEYPITKTHFGLTPGWLKTLLRQLAGYRTVTWPLLYDRWLGACLKLEGVTEIILIAGFPDPTEIPWLRFVAVAAGFLTTCLTNTMILICELLTEEPEGGSAMIPFSIFADLYRFLAAIDASTIRIVRNFYFTESNLSLTKREPEPSVMSDEKKFDALDRSIASVERSMEEEQQSETYSYLRDYLAKMKMEAGAEEEGEGYASTETKTTKKEEAKEEEVKINTHSSCYIILDPDEGTICRDKHEKDESSSESTESMEVVEITRSAEKIDEGSTVTEEVEEEEHVESVEMSSKTYSTEICDGYTEVELPAVPGIGPVVPEELVEAVLKYLVELANKQQGMVMPRNIRHFLCPPLEVFEK